MPRKTLTVFIAIVQCILFFAHLFLYRTWTFSLPAPQPLWLRLTVIVLSVSFVVSSMLAFRYTNSAVRGLYKASAIWLGFVSFLFLAAASSWLVYGIARLAGFPLSFHRLVEFFYAVAVAFGFLALFNASWTRVTRITVRLANLPDAWRGRR